MIEFFQRIVLGKYLYGLTEFVAKYLYLIGFLGFAYGLVLLYGSSCVRTKIPDIFNQFVLDSSSKILKENENISVNKLASKVYKEWVEYIPNLPSNIKIPTKKGWWLEKPTPEALEERLFFNEDKIIAMFNKKGA